ncbi:MAG: hypothetical protein IKE55_10785 [Kiritimatiellae bacterium]|nr:hypothetical protein [Kiritimatiellia bacterium]
MKKLITVVLSVSGLLTWAADVDITAAVRTAGMAAYSMIQGTPYSPIGGSYGLQCAFDGDTTSSNGRCLFNAVPSESSPVVFQYDIGAGFQPAFDIVVKRFTVVRLVTSYANVTRSPSVFELLGSEDGNTWKSLFAIDPGQPVTDWNAAERHTYVIPAGNRGNYRHYRFRITRNNGCNETTGLGLQELILEGGIEMPESERRTVRSRASVFDDVYFWLKGAVDKDNDGILDQGELVEAFHAGKPDHAFNQGYAYADNQSAIRITRKDFVLPYAYKTVYQQPCIDLYQKDDEDPTKYRPGSVRLPDIFPVTNNYTVVARLHLENFFSGTTLAMPFSLGYSWASAADGGSRGLPCYFRGQWNDFKLYFGDGNYGPTAEGDLLSTRGWIDLALVVHGTDITIYTCTVNRQPVVTEAVGAWHETSADNARRDLWLGNGDKLSVATTDSSKLNKFFCGQFHQFAVWDRTLTKEEVLEAFSWTGDDVVCYGQTDGSSDEFAGDGSEVTYGSDHGWYDLPSALTSEKPSVTVKFNAPNANYAGVPQILRISSATNSAPSVIAVSLNGTPLSSLNVYPGETSFCLVPSGVLLSVSNELVVARARVGEGVLRFDAIGLGGGWQIGARDDSMAEFYGSDAHYYLCHNNQSYFRRALAGQPDNVNSNVFVHFSVPEELSPCSRYRLTVRMRRIGDANQELNIAINGSVRRATTFADMGWTDVVVDLWYGDLAPVRNELRLTNVSPTGNDNSWMEIDCVRLEPLRVRNPNARPMTIFLW